MLKSIVKIFDSDIVRIIRINLIVMFSFFFFFFGLKINLFSTSQDHRYTSFIFIFTLHN